MIQHKLDFRRWLRLGTTFLLAIALVSTTNQSASATGGSWGGSLGGFGSGGGSWGGSMGGGLGSGGGSMGGSNGGLFGGRRPLRNLLGRIGSRFSGGSGGSSVGGSRGGFSGGSMGGSNGSSMASFGSTGGWSNNGGWSSNQGYYAGNSYSSANGSWGSSYGNTFSTPAVGYSAPSIGYSAPSIGYSDYSYSNMSMAAPMMSDVVGSTGCATCGVSGGVEYGNSVQPGLQETGYSLDTGFYDGSMPTDAGMPIDGGAYDPGVSNPTDYYQDGIAIPGATEGDGGTLPLSPGPAGNDSTSTRPTSGNSAILSVVLPKDAKVYINNRLTKTRGSQRNYVSKQLKNGRDYSYRVKAIVTRDGKQLVRTKIVNLTPGVTRTVKMDFEMPVTTVLAVSVPKDATVRLCGSKTSATGESRFFETKKLQDGQSWENYEIEVTVNRRGKEIVERKSVTLLAGETHNVAFDFNDSTGQLVAAK